MLLKDVIVTVSLCTNNVYDQFINTLIRLHGTQNNLLCVARNDQHRSTLNTPIDGYGLVHNAV